jgi:hypothetical protein
MYVFEIVVSVISLLYLLVLLPLLLGTLLFPQRDEKNKDFSMVFIWGFIVELFLFEIIYTPFILFYNRFSTFSNTLTIVYGMLSALLLFRWLRKHKTRQIINVKNLLIKENILWIFPLSIIAFQLFMSLFYQYLDGDDAYYMAQSTAAYMTDYMYGFEPYTGSTTTLDMRHGMAGIPIFISYLSRMTGIHPAIMGHTAFSSFLILLTYFVFYQLAKKLFKNKKKEQALFLGFIALLQMFGNSTIYTNETFFLTRTSQGKAVMASFIIPLLFLLFFEMIERMEVYKSFNYKRLQLSDIWIRIIMIQIAAVACTTLAVYLVPLLLGVGFLLIMIHIRKIKPMFIFLGCLFPSLFYGVLYLLY